MKTMKRHNPYVTPFQLHINDGFLTTKDRLAFVDHLRQKHPSLTVWYYWVSEYPDGALIVEGGTAQQRRAVRRATVQYVDNYIEEAYREHGHATAMYMRSRFNTGAHANKEVF